MPDFSPDYLNIDFITLVNKFKEELKSNDVFRDYNFEGSNISILLELMAYIGELNTFFINKIAKNTFLETADVYEAANRLARQVGYEPRGIRSARATLTVEVSASAGDTVRVLPWKQLNSGRTDINGNEIKFCTTSLTETIATGNLAVLRVPIRQGIITDITGYKGSDLIDNELVLPKSYAYDDDLGDDIPSVRVLVNDEEWTRVSDFYLDVIPNASDNVYMLIYDRYQRNKIVFNSSRNVPNADDTIEVRVLESLGPDGSIGADVSEEWSIESTNLADVNYTLVNNDIITISLSAASVGAGNPETIDEIRFNSASALRAQFRNVTANDYNSHLSSRADIVKANAYSEQDLAPSGAGDPQEYNIVNISVIPEAWQTSTINTSAGSFITDWSTSASTLVPLSYSSTWTSELFVYLRPRKMLSAYEVFQVPELVYFTFEIGIRKKRIYEFSDIQNDVLNKLIYYFRPENHAFNSIISFNDISEYLLDTSETSPDDDFVNIKGIRNLNIRDINVAIGNDNSYPIAYGSVALDSEGRLLYPRWADPIWVNRDNMLRRIQLGFNQFPYLASDSVSIIEEV